LSKYLNYIADNSLYIDEKRGTFFSIAYELSIFDEILDNKSGLQRKSMRFVDLVGPAVELWLQNIMNENKKLLIRGLEKEDWKSFEVFFLQIFLQDFINYFLGEAIHEFGL